MFFNMYPDLLFSVRIYLGPLIESLQNFFASIQHQIVVGTPQTKKNCQFPAYYNVDCRAVQIYPICRTQVCRRLSRQADNDTCLAFLDTQCYAWPPHPISDNGVNLARNMQNRYLRHRKKKSIFGSRLALRNRLNVINAKTFGRV